MSLTIVYKGKNKRTVIKLSRKKLFTFTILALGLLTVSSRHSESVEEIQARLHLAQDSMSIEHEQVKSLSSDTKLQLDAMLMQMAKLRHQLNRLDVLGQRVIEHSGLDAEEFDFGVLTEEQTEVSEQNQILQSIQQLQSSIEDKTKQLHALETVMLSHNIQAESRIAGRPISSGWLSSYYGMRKDPFSGNQAMHKGIDFAGKENDTVKATGAGIVTWAGSRYGYGNLVEINHGNGLSSRYGHNKVLSVKVGDVVTKGQEIALMGNTGRSTGAHVHYEVLKNGRQLDPLPYVYRRK